MRYSTPLVRSATVVSLALGLAACSQQAAVPSATAPAKVQAAAVTEERTQTFLNATFVTAAADTKGNLYVGGGVGVGVVRKFSQNLEPIWRVTLSGSQGGQVQKVAADRSDNVSVLANLNDLQDQPPGRGDTIARYAPDGTQLWRIGGKDNNDISGLAEDIGVDRVGNTYTIAIGGPSYFNKISPAGVFVSSTAVTNECSTYTGLLGVSLSGLLYGISRGCIDEVEKLDQIKTDFTPGFHKNISEAVGLAVSPAGSAFVLRTAPNLPKVIDKYNVSGALQWSRGLLAFDASAPAAIAVSDAAKVYIAGRNTKGNVLLEKRDPDTGEVLSSAEILGSQGYTVKAVTVGALGKVWVVGSYSNGSFISRFSQ